MLCDPGPDALLNLVQRQEIPAHVDVPERIVQRILGLRRAFDARLTNNVTSDQISDIG